jgi:SAM-dependent methyltransferase
MIPVATTTTHVHVAAVINTEIARSAHTVRLLDVGCGDGRMLAYLLVALRAIRPMISWKLYGLDVLDDRVQADGAFLQGARARLREAESEVDWGERIKGIATADAWPYEDAFFDVIVSNQVLEHVGDLDFSMCEIYRTLRAGGVSAHVFPLRAVLNEAHVRVPLAHKTRNHDLSRWYLAAANRLGIGRYDSYNLPGDDLRAFAAREADRLWNYTSYRSYAEVLDTCRRARLRASFRYTPNFYRAKVRSMRRQPPLFTYNRHVLGDWIGVRLLQYISNVTLFLEKRDDVPPRLGSASDG